MARTTPRKPRPAAASSRNATAASRNPPQYRKPEHTARRTAGQVFGVLALLLLGALSLYGGYLYRDSAALRKYLPSLWHTGLHAQDPAGAFPGQSALNLLVIGRDYDYNDRDQVLKTHARSDMLMVAHLDFAKKTVSLLSIPRDTRALIPGHGVTKINAAHAFGGPALTAQTVQQNFGIPTDHYVALDFQGFEQAIDLLGGVDLAVDKRMDYDDNWGHLHIHLRPGFQHLNGQQAMGFVRFRHSDSDLIRVQRQQSLLVALKTKLREPQTLAKLPQLLDLLDAHLASDLSPDQKIALACFVHDTPRDQIQMATLPSREAGASVTTDWPRAAPMIQRLFGVSPVKLADAASASPHLRRRHHRRLERLAELP
jgi:LCP family protein required for cell wall assembly